MKFSFKKLTAAVLTALGISALAAGVAGCVPKSMDVVEPDNIEITKLAPPDDGSLPTAHTCAENVAYLNYVFQNQKVYHSYSYGETVASIAKQTTRTFRDYKNGVLITTDLTYSSMVKNGTQTCTVFNEDGEGEVYFRVSDTPKENTVPTTAVWSTEAPTYFTERAYHYTYGLLPTELFNYITNADTIVDSGAVQVNGDGTYTQRFTFDPVASTYYYQFGMKTRGGLGSFPEYNAITCSVTFDGGWKILSCSVYEESTINKGVIVDSVSNFTCDYWYDGDNFDQGHYDYYENYYKQYIGDETLEQGGGSDEALVVDVTSVLSNGFASIMNGGDQFEINIRLGENTYAGYVYLSLDLADPLESIALKLSLGKTLQTQNFYLEYAGGDMSAYYGEDFALSANLAEVKLAIERFAGVIDTIKSSFTADAATPYAMPLGAEDESDPVSALMNSMRLIAGERQAVLTLDTDDLLGLGIGVNATLVFSINNSEISFRSGLVKDISIGGEKLDVSLGIAITTAPEISREKTGANANLADYIADVHSLLSADLLKFKISLNGDDKSVKIDALKGLGAEVTAYADVDGVAVGADADVSYKVNGAFVSAKLSVWYGYRAAHGDYGDAVVSIKEFNGSPVSLSLKCNVKDVAEAIATLLSFSGADLSLSVPFDGVVSVINGALSSNFHKLLGEMYADKSQIKIGVNVDTLLKMLSVDAGVKFGYCTLSYKMGGRLGGEMGASLPALGLELSLSGADGEVTKPDDSDALDISYVIEDVKDITGAEVYRAHVGLNGDGEGVTVEQLAGVKCDLTAYLDINNVAVGADAYVSYATGGSGVSAKLSIWYDNSVEGGRVAVKLSEINGTAVSLGVRCNLSEVTEAVQLLLDGLGVNLPSLQISGVEKDALGDVINDLLAADFNALIPEIASTADGLRLAVNIDEALSLFGVELGTSLGNVALAYSHSGDDILVASVPALGLDVSFNTCDKAPSAPDTGNCLDLTYAVNDVNKLLNSETVRVELNLDGESEAVTLRQLAGLKAQITAYASIDKLAAAMDIDLSYNVKGNTVSAKLSAYYDYKAADAGKYGKVALSVGEINGVTTALNVYCDIEELVDGVTSLVGYINTNFLEKQDEELTEAEEKKTVDVLANLLSADLSELIPEIGTSSGGATLAVDADKVLELFDVKVGFSLGTVRLAYVQAENSYLTADLQNLGLSVRICGDGTVLKAPDTADYLNVADLAGFAAAVAEKIVEIKDNQSIAFLISKGETFLSLDGIVVEIWGDGEICWKKGCEYVALDLAFSITERASDTATFRFIYDKNASETPLVRLALNEVGIDIYKDDVDLVTGGFKDIYGKIAAVLGTTDGGSASAESDKLGGAAPVITSNDKLMGVLFEILSSQKSAEYLNNLTLETDGSSLALSYLSENKADIKISADGDLGLNYKAAIGKRFTLGGAVTVNANTGSLVSVIEDCLSGCRMSSSKNEGSAAFTKLAYDFLFDAISGMTVDNILGSDTYTVKFVLNGDNCGADELKGILVDAEIYVTGADENSGKLAEGYLNIDAKGVAINIHVITERVNGETYFYINLSRVADVKLPDLKLLATQTSLYDTFKVLVSTINDTDLTDMVGSLMVKNSEEETKASEPDGEDGGLTEEQVNTVADLLSNILNFKFSEAVISTETDNVLTAEIDLDNVLKQLGVKAGALGKVEAVINHGDHSMKTTAKAEITDADGVTRLKEWISLSSELASRRSYENFDRAEYISIEFLPDLICDLVKFATDDDGKMHKSFTLSGSISATVVKILDVNFDVVTVTVDLQDGLKVSLLMHVKQTKVLGIGINEGLVGLTYQNGLLTLGRKLSTSSPEYKIMTFDYFTDHMLTKNNSVLQWWLNISGWDTLIGLIGSDLSVSSGITTPEDVYLYKAQKEHNEQEISMYDYVKALRVILDGRQTARFGDESEIAAVESDLGVYDNYYGFSLAAEKVTGGVLTKLNAALTRDENGLSGLRASGAIQSYVSFVLKLNYKEDWKDSYTVGNTVSAGDALTVPSMYDLAVYLAAANGVENIDFDHFVKKPAEGYDEIFGCFSTTDLSYDHSHALYTHTLTVVGIDGKEEKRDVRHGSTIYLYDNSSPLYLDDSKLFRILYSLSEDFVGATTATMESDMTVYAVKRASVNVIVHNGAEEYVVNSFVGDKVPTTVVGLDTITAPTYQDGGFVGQNDIITGTEVIHIYGTFVLKETVVNYVKYTFDAENLCYVASGRAAGFADEYSIKGNTLILQSYIGGYPVKEIGAYAFADTEDKPLKNVVVPATVTKIGAGAFENNYGMEKVILLAANVEMGGTAGTDNNGDTDQPFYGCSTTKGGKSASLEIYYNEVTFPDMTWTKFYVDTSGLIKHRYYIGNKPNRENSYASNGGGVLHSAGSWCYAQLNVIGAEEVTELDFAAAAEEKVSVGLRNSSVTEGELRAIESELAGALSEYKNSSGDNKYVVSAGQGKVNGYAVITVSVSLNKPVAIKVKSDIDCTYSVGENSQNIAAGESTCYVVKAGDNVILNAPKADGYVFLGWAKMSNGSLEFVGEQTEYEEGEILYAIWGCSKVKTAFTAEINYGGTALNAPAGGQTDGLWYDDNWNVVTSLSPENTVFYTRTKFTFAYKVSGSGSNITDSLAGKNNVFVSNSGYNSSFEVLEGQLVTVECSSDKYTLTFKVDGNTVNTVTLEEFRAIIKLHYTWKTGNAYPEVTVNSDLFYTFAY